MVQNVKQIKMLAMKKILSGVPFGQLSCSLNICKGMVGFPETQPACSSLRIFNGQDSWPEGAPDSVLCPLLPQPLPEKMLKFCFIQYPHFSMLHTIYIKSFKSWQS